MTMKQTRSAQIGRRAELIAELFLQDLGPSFVAKPTDDLGYDFLVGFPNNEGGVNSYVVELKATEQPVPLRYPLNAKLYERLVLSNIPAFLLVVDVKQNRVFYSLLFNGTKRHRSRTIRVPLTEANDVVKEQLRRQLKRQETAMRTAAER